MRKILIAYSSVDGHTKKICEFASRLLTESGDHTTLMSVDEMARLRDESLETYDVFLIGAAIRYGHHGKDVYRLLASKQSTLERIGVYFFSVNLVARKPNKDSASTNPYLRKFLNKTQFKPTQCAVFAGKVDYKKYGFFDRVMIRFIMWLTKGPTQPDAEVEFTDWNAVERFVRAI